MKVRVVVQKPRSVDWHDAMVVAPRIRKGVLSVTVPTASGNVVTDNVCVRAIMMANAPDADYQYRQLSGYLGCAPGTSVHAAALRLSEWVAVPDAGREEAIRHPILVPADASSSYGYIVVIHGHIGDPYVLARDGDGVLCPDGETVVYLRGGRLRVVSLRAYLALRARYAYTPAQLHRAGGCDADSGTADTAADAAVCTHSA